jgi:enoyl-CoA hydratase/carnithine racemase
MTSDQHLSVSNDVLFAVREGVGWVTFNRPAARNAFTFAMYERLAAICQQWLDGARQRLDAALATDEAAERAAGDTAEA